MADFDSICAPPGLPGGRTILEPLAENLGLEFYEFDPAYLGEWKAGVLDHLELIKERRPALLMLPTSIPLGGALLESLSGHCQFIGNGSTGTDHVDAVALADAGIGHLFAPGCNARSVVEYVLAGIPLLFQAREWARPEFRVGIVGFGRIGSQLGRCLEQMEIQYCYADPFVAESDSGQTRRVDLATALHCDLTTFHVPLTDAGEHATRNMIHKTAQLGAGTALINSSRGPVFTRSAFQGIARERTCIMDVFPVEPPDSDLRSAPTCVTPHIAGYNYSARLAGVRMVAEQLAEARAGDAGRQYMATLARATDFAVGHYAHYVTGFLPAECQLFRRTGTFHQRRNNYPPRGDLQESIAAADAGLHDLGLPGDFAERLRACL